MVHGVNTLNPSADSNKEKEKEGKAKVIVLYCNILNLEYKKSHSLDLCSSHLVVVPCFVLSRVSFVNLHGSTIWDQLREQEKIKIHGHVWTGL